MKSFNQIWLSFSLVLLPVTAALGQSEGVLEEVTVTAQKRDQSVQDIPVAVTVLTGESLLQLGIDNSVAIADYTPGLTVSPVFGIGNIPNISIRGVGMNDFRDYHESPSAVYVDEVYKASLASLDFQLFDIDRVEVLKGPQGTLFGRNATGGLVHYITRKPTEETEGYARVAAGTFGELKAEAAVGGTLGGFVSGRLAVVHHQNDGIQQNQNPEGENGNQLDLTALRGQLNFDFTEDLSLLLSFETARNDNKGGNPYRYAPSYFGPDGLAEIDYANRDIVVGTDDFNDINVSGGLLLKTDYSSGTARLDWSFNNFNLISITNFQNFEKDQIQDCDSAPAVFCITEYSADTDQFSQELRFQGDHGDLQWDAGLYYFTLNSMGTQTLAGPVAGFFFGAESGTTAFDTETESWAAFGQVAYSLSEDVTLIGGLRYTDDQKDMSQTFLLGVIPGGILYDRSTIGDLARQNNDNVSYSAKVTWDMNDTTMLYGGISSAFKSGTFNSGFGPVPLSEYSVDPEKLTSYEAGFKTDFSGGRQRLNGAVFYYDYKDSQAFVFQDLNQLLFNADANVTGAELEWFALPVDGLEISAGASWLSTTVKNVQDRSGAIYDRNMVLAPALSMNAMARYTWDLSSGASMAAQLDGNYSSKVYFDNLNQPGLTEGAYAKLNARMFWLSDDGAWEIAAWVNNLTNEGYRVYAFDLTGDLGYIEETWASPRTYGVSVAFNF
jgi:iron complex outermembrane receptor protein